MCSSGALLLTSYAPLTIEQILRASPQRLNWQKIRSAVAINSIAKPLRTHGNCASNSKVAIKVLNWLKNFERWSLHWKCAETESRLRNLKNVQVAVKP